MIDKVTGQSLGYGFVKYFKADDATKGIQALNGTALENKILKVSYARPASSDIQNSNVYISGLDVNISKPELDAIFSSYGKIIDSKILHDHRTGVSRGVGFVRYNSKAEAEASIAALNGTTLPGMNQPLFVKMADNFDEKIRRKEEDLVVVVVVVGVVVFIDLILWVKTQRWIIIIGIHMLLKIILCGQE